MKRVALVMGLMWAGCAFSEIPVVCEDEQAVLSPEVVQNVVRESLVLIENEEPWFLHAVRVRAGIVANLYFKPDAQTGRLRRGQFCQWSVWGGKINASGAGTKIYAHVASPSEAWDDQTIPAVSNLPVEMEATLSDDEIVSLVDFLKSQKMCEQVRDMKPPLSKGYKILSITGGSSAVRAVLEVGTGIRPILELRKENEAWTIVAKSVIAI